MINELIDQINQLNILNQYYIIFGILDEDKYREIEINILNPDDTVSSAVMEICDVMYLTENGTAILPGKHILERIVFEIEYRINYIINEIIDGVFNNNWQENEIDSKMKELEVHLQHYIRNQFRGEIETNGINALLGIKDDKKYIYNFNILEQYIKCKVIKK